MSLTVSNIFQRFQIFFRPYSMGNKNFEEFSKRITSQNQIKINLIFHMCKPKVFPIGRARRSMRQARWHTPSTWPTRSPSRSILPTLPDPLSIVLAIHSSLKTQMILMLPMLGVLGNDSLRFFLVEFQPFVNFSLRHVLKIKNISKNSLRKIN